MQTKLRRKSSRLSSLTMLGSAGILFASRLAAGDLMEINVSNATDLLGVPLGAFSPVGSSSAPDLIKTLSGGRDQFASLLNATFSATMRYADVPNALGFTVSGTAGNWNAILSTPFAPSLINQSFTAATRDDLEQQLKDYLKKDGSKDLARLLNALDARSALGVNDGNPNSSTALAASGTFSEHGRAPVATKEEREAQRAQATGIGLSMAGDSGFIQANGYSAQSFSYTPYLPSIQIGKKLSLQLGMPLNYTDLEGAQIFRAGLSLGCRYVIVTNTRDPKTGAVTQPWHWQVTPSVGTEATASLDMMSGGLMNNFGVTSLALYDFGKFEISMGNQVTHHESVAVSFGGYDFDPDISSQIVKNGLKFGLPLGRRWFTEAYAIDTEFTGNSLMGRYTTLGAGFGYRRPPRTDGKRHGYIMVGAYSNFGDHYSSANIALGTGWRF